MELPSTDGAMVELTCAQYVPNIAIISVVYIEDYQDVQGECHLPATACQMDVTYNYRLTCNGKASCTVSVHDDTRQRGEVLCDERPMRLLINYACKQESEGSASFGTPGACARKRRSSYCLGYF